MLRVTAIFADALQVLAISCVCTGQVTLHDAEERITCTLHFGLHLRPKHLAGDVCTFCDLQFLAVKKGDQDSKYLHLK